MAPPGDRGVPLRTGPWGGVCGDAGYDDITAGAGVGAGARAAFQAQTACSLMIGAQCPGASSSTHEVYVDPRGGPRGGGPSGMGGGQSALQRRECQ